VTDAPLAGLAFFGGWILLLVASDVAALLKMSNRRASLVQNALLLGSIAAAIAFGTAAYSLAHAHAAARPPAGCAPRAASGAFAHASAIATPARGTRSE
jgi:hypothetical protein